MPERAIEEYKIADEPFYLPVDHEIDLFQAAHAARLPVILKGPTGCGKTRFVEHMAWRLERPLITVACHEDLSSTDLVGRFLIESEETVWHDGPLTTAVRHGAICYLDEIVEARKDTVVIIHPLTDHRRRLPIEKRGTILDAPADFMLVVSYNPGYQSILKDLKQSTRQRFVAIDFDYPPPDLEAAIVAREGGLAVEGGPPEPEDRQHRHRDRGLLDVQALEQRGGRRRGEHRDRQQPGLSDPAHQGLREDQQPQPEQAAQQV